jgi:hypothetical protein
MQQPKVGDIIYFGGEQWHLIGFFGVDSGQVIITDPCYIKDWKDDNDDYMFTGPQGEDEWGQKVKEHQRNKKYPFTYLGSCARTLSKPDGGELTNEYGANLAVVSSTMYGDGTYPVYAVYDIDDSRRPRQLMIDFEGRFAEDEEEEEDEEDDGCEFYGH